MPLWWLPCSANPAGYSREPRGLAPVACRWRYARSGDLCHRPDADFRQRPHATVEAHVGLLSQVLRRPGLEKLLFLSSTRVYSRSEDLRESAPLPCLSCEPSDLYNLSKLLGEALVLQDPRPGLKVVRLSNVVGPSQPESTFVGALLTESRRHGKVTIQQSADSVKDYVALRMVRLLPLIASHGKQRLYNLGSGRNISREVAAWLMRKG